MEDILDDHILRKNKLGIFSKLSFSVGVFMNIKFIYSVFTFPSEISANEELSTTTEGSNLHYLTFIVIAGAIFALLSIIKKEDYHWIKWAGVIINFLWLLIMVIGIVYP